MDIEEKIDLVLSHHKRKVSQLEAVKQEMMLYFDEEESTEIARSIMREKIPNYPTPPHSANIVTLKHIVATARMEHTRRKDKLDAISQNSKAYFTNDGSHEIWLLHMLECENMRDIVAHWFRIHIHSEICIENMIALVLQCG